MIIRFFSLALFLIFILNAAISHSQTISETENQVWQSSDLTPTYYFLYLEDGKYVISKILVPENSLQKIVKRHVFSSSHQVLRFLNAQKDANGMPPKEVSPKTDLSFSKIQTEDPTQVIWSATNEWSWEWEQKYSDWIKENFNKDFFVKYKIETDCADVAVSLRWIFARINSLPAAQTFILSNRIFSNESMKKEWENIPTSENWFEDQRFLTALKYVLENTYTHSLYADSYPIEISPQTLLLGTHFLILRAHDGHTLLVSEIVKDKKIYTLSSTTPAAVRRLTRKAFTESQPKYYDSAQKGGGGFLKIRWPRKIAEGFELIPAVEMPHYSLEQYADDFIKNDEGSFTKEVHTRLGLNLTPEDRYHEYVANLFNALTERIQVVEEGFAFCSINDCAEGTPGYDTYSTPARDGHISEAIKDAQDVVRKYGWRYPDITSDWKVQQSAIVTKVNDQVLSLEKIIEIWNSQSYSSNPNDPIPMRWGIAN